MEVYTLNEPYFYRAIDYFVARRTPSTVHTRNTDLQRFLEKYLLQRAMSPYDFTVPDNWDKNFFMYVLFYIGYIGIVNTDKFGVICQPCGLEGYNVYYMPKNIVVVNPLLRGMLRPEIGKNCEIIKLMPDYSSIMDIVYFYTDKLAIAWETFDVDILNSRLAYVFASKNKAAAESFKVMMDGIMEGNPAVFIDKNLFDTQGKPTWTDFNQNLKNTYIASDVLSDIRRIIEMFDTEIGIENANIDKRERLIKDEVQSNNIDTKSKASIWFDCISESMEKVRKMFGYSENDLKIDWRWKNENDNINAGTAMYEAGSTGSAKNRD